LRHNDITTAESIFDLCYQIGKIGILLDKRTTDLEDVFHSLPV